VHTIDMAGAYATFAADGMRHEPFFVRQYNNSHGTVEYQRVDKPKPAFDPVDTERNSQLARNVTATLTDVARSSQIPLAGGRQVAAKTGTQQRGETNDNSAAWTVGYTPSISTAVWVGDPANTAIKTARGADIFGRGVPGLIWQRFMNSYLMNTPLETFPPFTVIGQAPTPTRVKQPRDVTPSATPEPDDQDLTPTLIAPTQKPTRTTKPQRSCYPFCDSAGSGEDNPAPDNNDNPDTGDRLPGRPQHF
jgi:membrane peptidoglycan carboxypeptidase